MMRIFRFSLILIVPAVIALCVMARATPRQAHAMNHHSSSFESEAGELPSQDTNAQTGSDTAQANESNPSDSGLAKYPDKPVASIPSQPVSPRYVVEHRSALNGKTITVRGIVARTLWPSDNAAQGEQSMANPQPRIFLADNLRKRRDKNYDLMVLLREGERGYVVGRKATIKVRVDASKVAVVLRKIASAVSQL